MNNERKHLLADLEAIGASIQDPAKRAEVLKIIARLSPESDEWPNDAEPLSIRSRYDDNSK